MRRLLIIPARGGSRRIKNKNIKIFYNKPIIYYPLIAAKNSKLFKKIHVSTESKKIKSVVKQIGFKNDFYRDKKLSNDNVGIIEVVNFVIKKFSEKNIFFDEVWCLYASSPLINKNDLIKISKSFTKQKNSFLTVSKFPAPIYWAFRKTNKDKLKPVYPKKLKIDSRKFGDFYYDNGCLIILKKKDFFKPFNKIYFSGYDLPIYKAVDIDNMEDWKLATKFYKL